jgi:hypothetical protein
MFTIAVVTHMEAVAIGDAHKTTAGVAEAHLPIHVESGDTRQFLVGEVGANPLTNDLFRVP